jgi:thiamine pyrophosphate-dependent acetolactate synthase large subunit-like protein
MKKKPSRQPRPGLRGEITYGGPQGTFGRHPQQLVPTCRRWTTGPPLPWTPTPVNPEYVVHALDGKLPDNVILSADSGSAANRYARHLRLRGNMRGSLSGTLATMGPGVPYAIGAKSALPDRPSPWSATGPCR